MKCFSLRLRFELAGAMLLAALFAPLALQAEDDLFDQPAS